MEGWGRKYLIYTKRERYGIAALCACILLLVLFRAWLMFYQPVKIDEEEIAALSAVWKTLQERPEEEPLLFPFDPNAIDSLQARQLGLPEVTTRMLLNWRRKGKIFYKKEDFREVYTLSEADWERLEPYIVIPVKPRPLRSRDDKNKKTSSSFPADLNRADSLLLLQVRGIGPGRAGKIIGRRRVLGGYTGWVQFSEIHRFPDTLLQELKEKFFIGEESIRTISVNTASEEALRQHPYIGKRLAGYIIRYREDIGGYTDIRQLRQVPLMNEEIYRKIAPYLTLD